MNESDEQSPDTTRASPAADDKSQLLRLLVLVVAVVIVGVGGYLLRDELTLARLAERESQFRDFQQQQPILVYFAAFAVYVLVTGLSLPGAAAMTLLIGWLFGFWRAAILVSFASTAGATIAFLLSRYLFGDAIQDRFGDRLEKFNAALDREGAFYLFTLRLIPVVPFFVINVVMGLTRIRVFTYWWVSQIGMLPGTCVYVYAGSTVPDLETLAARDTGEILSLQLVIAFVLLGIFPLVAKWTLQRFRPRSA